jgi:hypothetical protein
MPKKVVIKGAGEMTIADLVRKGDISKELLPVFDKLRLQSFEIVKAVYADREKSYDGDQPCYKVFAYNVLSMASVMYEKAWRAAQLLSPTRTEPLRDADLNRIVDSCIDGMNYYSWMYALMVLATGYEGHENSDDAPDYIGRTK